MGRGFGEIHRAFILPELVENPDKVKTSPLVDLQDDWWKWHCGLTTSTNCTVDVLSSQMARLQLKRSLPNEFETADWTRPEAVFLFYHK